MGILDLIHCTTSSRSSLYYRPFQEGDSHCRIRLLLPCAVRDFLPDLNRVAILFRDQDALLRVKGRRSCFNQTDKWDNGHARSRRTKVHHTRPMLQKQQKGVNRLWGVFFFDPLWWTFALSFFFPLLIHREGGKKGTATLTSVGKREKRTLCDSGRGRKRHDSGRWLHFATAKLMMEQYCFEHTLF